MGAADCRRGMRWARLAGATAVAAALAGCLSSATGLETSTAAGSDARLGSFDVASIGAPPGTISPASCGAGDHELFLGADLVDPDTRLVVRLVVDPIDGPVIRVYDADAPFDRSVVFFRDECTTFTMDLAETGTMVNNIVERRLELEIECENADGATIRGRASAARCD